MNESAKVGLTQPYTQIRLFGKPSIAGERRLGVALAQGCSIEAAREAANKVAGMVKVKLNG